jgi:hypothetical protein
MNGPAAGSHCRGYRCTGTTTNVRTRTAQGHARGVDAQGGGSAIPTAQARDTAHVPPLSQTATFEGHSMKTKPLPPELRRLAAVLVHERFRREAWTATAALRRNLHDRITAGESVDALLAELRAAVVAASR